jgi:hypothetical protein
MNNGVNVEISSAKVKKKALVLCRNDVISRKNVGPCSRTQKPMNSEEMDHNRSLPFLDVQPMSHNP